MKKIRGKVACLLSLLFVFALCFTSGEYKTKAEGSLQFSIQPTLVDRNFTVIDDGEKSTQLVGGRYLSFVNNPSAYDVMVVSKNELTAPYTIEFEMYSNAGGYPGGDGGFVLGHKDSTLGGTSFVYGGGFSIIRSVGGLELPKDLGVKLYDSTGKQEVTEGNFIYNALNGYAINQKVLYKFEVLENGHINLYYDFSATPNALTTLRNVIKPEDGRDLEVTKKGYFAFMPIVVPLDAAGGYNVRHLYYYKENDTMIDFDKADEGNFDIIGNKNKVCYIYNNFEFLDYNNSTVVSNFQFTDKNLTNDDDVVFDISFMTSRRHGTTSPTWGLAFGMESQTMDIATADRFEWSIYNGQVYTGASAKANDNGAGVATGIYNTGADLTVRLVGRKDGTLEEYQGIGAVERHIDTLYTTYSGLDFNGYIAFYSRKSLDSGVEDGVKYSFINIKGNAITSRISTMNGASIRFNSPNGIRFGTTVNKDDYDNLVATYGVENVKTGTVILPEKYVESGYLDGDVFDVYAYMSDKTEGKDYKVVENTLGFYNEATAEQDGYYLFYGSLVNVQQANLNKKFFGIGYITVTVDGKDVTLFGGGSISSHSRSISEVATSAYNDRSAVATSAYAYEVAEDGNYSLYTLQQLELLKKFIVE